VETAFENLRAANGVQYYYNRPFPLFGDYMVGRPSLYMTYKHSKLEFPICASGFTAEAVSPRITQTHALTPPTHNLLGGFNSQPIPGWAPFGATHE
jgi:hypothetical protein